LYGAGLGGGGEASFGGGGGLLPLPESGRASSDSFCSGSMLANGAPCALSHA
jgi:hypothetical protein